MLQIIIKSLDINKVDDFVCQDTDLYARIMRDATIEDPTVDLIVQIRAVEIDDDHIVFLFPNNCVLAVNIPSFHYHMVEVL